MSLSMRAALLSIMLLGRLSASYAATCAGQPCINIGSFNIRLLGTSGPADTAAEYEKLAGLIDEAMALDVVVLEEIDTSSDSWKAVRVLLEDRGYKVAHEGAFGGERDQFLVVAYKAETVSLAEPAPRDLDFPTTYAEEGNDCTYPNVRPPVVASFVAGDFDFRIVAVHLKSQTNVNTDPDCDDRIRTDQVERLLKFWNEEKGSEQDILIVGDMNMKFGGPELSAPRDAGWHTAMDDLEAGSADASYLGGGPYPPELIDHIAFGGALDEYVAGSGYILKLTGEDLEFHHRNLSDHVPVRASFYTAAGAD